MTLGKDSSLLVFIRAPVKGRVKSRLALSLDGEIVVDLYRNFILDVLDTARTLDCPIIICFEPADAGGEIARWLGDRFTYLAQQGEDLGERMENGFRFAFSEGFHRAVLIGSDSPDLPGEFIREAFTSLKQKDAVIGPALDGGYYLLGFRRERFLPEVFRGMPWGENLVFERTMEVFRRHKYDLHLLPEWHDVDRITDLARLKQKTGRGPGVHTRRFLSRHRQIIEKGPDISIIVPVFHEGAIINSAIEEIRRTDFPGTHEIIVVDGAGEGDTCKAIKAGHVKKVFSAKGRGNQMNKGARGAAGEILLFLHADTRIGPGGLSAIRAAVKTGGCVAGSFDLQIGAKGIAYRIIERVASVRTRITRIPYGDQAIFVRKGFFEKVGGYPEIPIMEDLELMRRIKRAGGRVRILKEKAVTSARRWEEEGLLYTTLRNWTLMALYLLGVSPQRLARYYRDRARA